MQFSPPAGCSHRRSAGQHPDKDLFDEDNGDLNQTQATLMVGAAAFAGPKRSGRLDSDRQYRPLSGPQSQWLSEGAAISPTPNRAKAPVFEFPHFILIASILRFGLPLTSASAR